MPSPIAHLGIGYAIFQCGRNKLPEERVVFWKIPLQLIIIMGLSMLPDLDIIPAIVFGDMMAYHNNLSHSILLAVPVGLISAVVCYWIYRSSFWMWFVVCLVSYDAHVIMDALTADRGVMMFWPLTQNRFASSIKIFYGLQWGLGWLSPWHLWTMISESLFVGLVLIIVHYFQKRINHAGQSCKK